ncbi:MAG: hypothetical protein KAU21_16605 [Gammaproteobacteria bacterium]|nr:hypothetical protein [Gammaproteobacteria bacterium]
MNKPTIDLIIPGLLNLPIHELNSAELASSTPALHKLLRYANRVSSSLIDFDDILIQRLGLKQSALPYARAIYPQNNSQQLLFKPIHLKADINNAIVFPIDDDEEINSIINDFKQFFKDDCDIEYLTDDCWMMTLLNCQPVTEVPHYLSALGKKVTHYLEQAKTNLAWFKLFNEMQMFLYQHAVNQQRQLKGQALINSLWCWGADEYQGEKITNTLWYSDDSDVQKLGELYAGHSGTIKDFKQADINSTSPNSNVVIVDLSILKILKGRNETGLQQALESLEHHYFETSISSAKHQIVVHTGGGFNFHYNSKLALKFWKKPVELSNIILQSQSQ